MWGDYLESIFVKERQLHLGVSAITCYLHACRHQNESKSEVPGQGEGRSARFGQRPSWGPSVGIDSSKVTSWSVLGLRQHRLHRFYLKLESGGLDVLGVRGLLSGTTEPGVWVGLRLRSSVADLDGAHWTGLPADCKGSARSAPATHLSL